MRLFLALRPPPTLRARLAALAERAETRCGGRRMAADSLHLTLAFLGEVSPATADDLVRWVDGLRIPAGHWRLDAWGRFARPGIVWVGGRHPDPALSALHRWLWHDLTARGLGPPPNRFVPHVTLLRRAASLELTALPPVAARWSYTELELIESCHGAQGAHYVTLARSRTD